MRKRNIIVTAALLIFAVSPVSARAGEYEELKTEMRMMKARVVELEARLEQYERTEKESAGHRAGHDHNHGEGFDIEIGHQHRHLDIHQLRVHGGLDLRYVDAQGGKNKFFAHEVEIGVGADLTDWLEAEISLTKHHGEDVEVEQAYGKIKMEELRSVVKAGRFFVNFGPENRAGFFDRRTVTPSAMREGFFGEENWTDEGIEISYRLPVGFESVISASALNGNNAETFGNGNDPVDNNNIVAAFNVHNSVDTDWGRLTAGGSYARGKWDEDDTHAVDLFGLDAGWKLRNFDIQGEYMYRKKESDTGNIKGSGFYVWGAYTWPVEWKYLKDVGLLFSYGESHPEKTDKERRYSPQVTFGLTDTAQIRLLYEILRESPDQIDNNRLIAQFAYHF